jgi:hypothetical protein
LSFFDLCLCLQCPDDACIAIMEGVAQIPDKFPS